MSNLPRGIRNNNPLNIRKSNTQWVGERPYLDGVQMDGQFCQFIEMKYGWRAAFKLLRKYINSYKCNTVRKIISRWAPASENNTENYIQWVAQRIGAYADEIIGYSEPAIILIAAAMCEMENGVQYSPFSDQKLFTAMIKGKALADHGN